MSIRRQRYTDLITLKLRPEVTDLLDSIAVDNGLNRSELLRLMIEKYTKQYQKPATPAFG